MGSLPGAKEEVCSIISSNLQFHYSMVYRNFALCSVQAAHHRLPDAVFWMELDVCTHSCYENHFVGASKVVDQPSKAIKLHSFML